MTYVEWLRVRNVLRVTAIILGIFIVIAGIVRISIARELDSNDIFMRHVISQPGTKVTHTVLPDGTKREIIVDASGTTTITIDDVAGGKHIVISEPRSSGSHHDEKTSIGSIEINEANSGNSHVTTIDTNGTVPFMYYMMVANITAFIIATVLAVPFARENDGHLEIAFTKPVAREPLALSMMGVDIVGILAASAMTIVALLICQSMFAFPHFDFSGVNARSIVIGIFVPLAWYAMINAATSSLKRGRGAVLAFAWPVAILVAVFGAISWGDTLVGNAAHAIFWTLSRIDPLTYIAGVTNQSDLTDQSPSAASFGPRVGIEIALFIGYSALALIQWRRVEA